MPENDIVYIPADLKKPLLGYLEKFHSISTESIYNDIHGFIRYQHHHQNAYVQAYMGFMLQKSPYARESLKEEQARYAGQSPEEKRTYKKAIEHYNKAINLNPGIGGVVYYNRGKAWLHLQKWAEAREDLIIAQDMGVNIVESFHNDYKKGVTDFKKKTGIVLPSYIAEMLEGDRYTKEHFYKPKRRPPKHLRVILKDGTIIERESQRKTFIAAIEEAGIEQVHALKLGSLMHPLVERKNTNDPPGESRISDTSGFYSIYRAYSAKAKGEHLRTISEKLGLQWDVEVIER